jgi:hypothetical protein
MNGLGFTQSTELLEILAGKCMDDFPRFFYSSQLPSMFVDLQSPFK